MRDVVVSTRSPVTIRSAYRPEVRSADEDNNQAYETGNNRFDGHANDAQDDSVNLALSGPLSPQVDEHWLDGC